MRLSKNILLILFITLFFSIPVQAQDTDLNTQEITLDMYSQWWGSGDVLICSVDTLFPENTSNIIPYYSLNEKDFIKLDSNDYIPWDLDCLTSDNAEDVNSLLTHRLLYGVDTPFKQYLEGEYSSFSMKLEIVLEDGTSFFTSLATLDREESINLPDDASVSAIPRKYLQYGKALYQITVTSDTTVEDIKSILPDTLAIEIQIFNSSNELLDYGVASLPVEWSLPSTIDFNDGNISITDALVFETIEDPIQLETNNGTYTLTAPISFNEYAPKSMELVINVVDDINENVVQLDGDTYDDLMLSFDYKPSGSTAIKAYYYDALNNTWVYLRDLVDEKDINFAPTSASYPYLTLCKYDETPYVEYLEGSLDTLLFALVIEGGIYDQEEILVSFPGDYILSDPLPEIGGSGGNENNLGGNNAETPDNSGGLRPGLTPPADSNDVVVPEDDVVVSPEIEDEEIIIPPTSHEEDNSVEQDVTNQQDDADPLVVPPTFDHNHSLLYYLLFFISLYSIYTITIKKNN